MQQQNFQVKDVTRLTGLGRQTVQYWLRKGLVQPEFTGHTPQGVARRFSIRNLIEFAVAKELSFYGIEAQHLAQVMTHCRSEFQGFWAYPEQRISHTEEEPLIIVLRGDGFTGFAFKTGRALREKGWGWSFWLGEVPAERLVTIPPPKGVDVLSELIARFASVLIINIEVTKRELLSRLV